MAVIVSRHTIKSTNKSQTHTSWNDNISNHERRLVGIERPVYLIESFLDLGRSDLVNNTVSASIYADRTTVQRGKENKTG